MKQKHNSVAHDPARRTEVRRCTLKRAPLPIAAGLFALLCACNPAPKYAKPPAPTPAAFKEVPEQYKEGAGWRVAKPEDDKIRGDWWEMYNDPQLSALERQVQVSNQSIKVAEANYRSAQALVVTARSSLFPAVITTPSFNNSEFPSARGGALITTSSGVPVSASSAAVNQYSLPATASYTIDLWHRIRNTVAAQAYSAQASAADVATAMLSMQSELAQDYFEVRALDEERAILEDTLNAYRQTLRLTQTLFKAGVDSDQDVAQAELQVDTAAASLTDVGVSRAQYEHAIAMLIGQPPANFSLPPAPFVANPPPVPIALPSRLLERRPDIAAYERQIAAANALIGVARAAYFPDLTLSATAGFQSSVFSKWLTWPSHFWSIGPAASQVVFENGALRGPLEQAQANYDATVANYRQTALTAFEGVEDQLAALRILDQEVGQQHTAVAAANHYLNLALTLYKTGVDSYLNVITAQTSLLSTRLAVVSVELRQMTASVNLVEDLGGGWGVTDLPKMHQILAKPAKWSPGGGPVPTAPAAVTTQNPPAVAPEPLQPSEMGGRNQH
jgi:NodT family efflux transporter outer membrane factor (OMF) lipoprotein